MNRAAHFRMTSSRLVRERNATDRWPVHGGEPPGRRSLRKESNWLPAPNDTIYLVLRLYWPKTEPLSILPPGEGTWQPPGVKRVA
jgi:hypothetical protein